jgi:enoyl-CoA hydratase/carnithine racemase
MILMAGQKIPADEALAFGLIDRIVPQDVLMQTAQEMCADTLAAPADIAKQIKAMCS